MPAGRWRCDDRDGDISFLGSLLPLIYALLGAVAFGIRDLRRRVADNTWTVAQELSATLRLLLAFFVGVVIGLFGDWTRGTSLSPIAVGFLAGYGVEYFFDFLDGILKAFGKGAGAARPDRAVRRLFACGLPWPK